MRWEIFWNPPPPLPSPNEEMNFGKKCGIFFSVKCLSFFFGGHLSFFLKFGEKIQFVLILFSKGLIIIPGSVKAWKDEHNDHLIWGGGPGNLVVGNLTSMYISYADSKNDQKHTVLKKSRNLSLVDIVLILCIVVIGTKARRS
jgi:hypothetical protein